MEGVEVCRCNRRGLLIVPSECLFEVFDMCLEFLSLVAGGDISVTVSDCSDDVSEFVIMRCVSFDDDTERWKIRRVCGRVG